LVFFNYTTMQASAKIVYYGPGLCGKTTNLQHIHAKTDPNSRGEMVSLETEADRTLFFDLLPLEVGRIGGMRVRLQLYTVPGQVFYNTTRKLVLKGVDGVVFVADSQVPAMDANLESFENLHENLNELNQPLDALPFVFQYNKRDLRHIQPVEVLNRYLNPKGCEVFEAAALHGVGVFETLKAISKKTLASVHRRIAGEQVKDERVAVPARVPPTKPRAPRRAPELEKTPSRPVSVATESSKPPGPAKPRPNTGEVKVEFAAGPASAPAKAKEPAPAKLINTKSRLDIERELDELRQIAWGGSPPSSVKKKAPRAKVLSRKDHDQQIELSFPKAALEKASQLVLELKFGSERSLRKFPEALRLDLPPRRPGKKTRLSITLDVTEEDK
jgi:signal recognition particle receptor subunit beta